MHAPPHTYTEIQIIICIDTEGKSTLSHLQEAACFHCLVTFRHIKVKSFNQCLMQKIQNLNSWP